MNSKIQHIEYYLPKKYETLKDLKKQNPSWDIEKIYKATGINKRHVALGENIVEMAEKSCSKLIKKNKIKDIDFLILVTQSSPTGVPTSANILHEKLNLSQKCLCFDINQGCSGFIYALAVATSLIHSNLCKSGIIVCSEKYSQYIEKNDSATRPIFSDGSSSIFITKSKKSYINSFVLGSDGKGYKNLIVPSKDTKIHNKILKKNKIYMDGSKVFLFTLNKVKECFNEVLNKANLDKDKIDFFIFHQASKFVIDNIIRKLEIDPKKNIINLNQVGNTVSASIPIALKMALEKKKSKKNLRFCF